MLGGNNCTYHYKNVTPVHTGLTLTIRITVNTTTSTNNNINNSNNNNDDNSNDNNNNNNNKSPQHTFNTVGESLEHCMRLHKFLQEINAS